MADSLGVDTVLLGRSAAKLADARVPFAPGPSVAGTGVDSVSAALNSTLPVLESAVTDGLPVADQNLKTSANKMSAAASMYAETDQMLGDGLNGFGFGAADTDEDGSGEDEVSIPEGEDGEVSIPEGEMPEGENPGDTPGDETGEDGSGSIWDRLPTPGQVGGWVKEGSAQAAQFSKYAGRAMGNFNQVLGTAQQLGSMFPQGAGAAAAPASLAADGAAAGETVLTGEEDAAAAGEGALGEALLTGEVAGEAAGANDSAAGEALLTGENAAANGVLGEALLTGGEVSDAAAGGPATPVGETLLTAEYEGAGTGAAENAGRAPVENVAAGGDEAQSPPTSVLL